MKRILACILTLAAVAPAMAQEVPQWIRKNAISPDGKTIAFSYKGDIFTVPSTGGTALQITSNKAYESDPVWNADGSKIVFTSTREGSKDIFVTGATGGSPRRLTTMPGNEVPLAVSAQGDIYFNWYTSAIQSPGWDGFPGDPALYRTNLEGAAPQIVTSLTICGLSENGKGQFLYEDWKGYEDPLRKHHTSSVTRDIWLWDGGKTFTKLTDYKGEDRNPVFGPDGDTFYYLSEENGKNINLFRSSISSPAKKEQLTSYEKNPVRYISVSNDGTVCYSYNGELYTLKAGAEPMKVNITVNRDEPENPVSKMQMKSASAVAVSPDGKEVALVIRGDVFVANVEFGTTRRITNTPEQERGVSFSKDGREIYYASERGGCWSIYKSTLTNKEDKYFTYTASFKEERVSPEGETSFQMEVSPDGKYLAYLRDRTELVVLPTSGGKPRSLHKNINYSYADGDQQFAWSPDSRYILTTWQADGGWNNPDIAVVEVETGKITDLTRSGYSDESFRWALGGKAMTWESDKNGYRSHGSWGAESDIYIMFFDGKAYADFGRSKEQKEIDKLLMGEKKAEKEEKKAEKDSTAKKVEKVNLDLENSEFRIERLTRFSNRMGDHYLTPDGSKLYFTQRLEKGFDLCALDIEKGDISVVKKGVMGRFTPSPDGKSLFILRGAQLSKLDVATGKDKPVSFSGEFEFKPQKEREYIFEHCWKQVKEKFYDPALHGVDWDYYRENYAAKLPFVNNDYDFADLLSEMLGELNGSHTGCRYRPRSGHTLGHLGILADTEYKGDGIKIAEVLPGGALNNMDTQIKAGDIITAIEGHQIKAGENWLENLYDTAGKRILITVKSSCGKKKDIFVKPAATDAQLLYKRWVRQREEMVEKLSGGKVGYVHIQGMDSDSYRELYSKALGKYRNCDALIVDTRHNGGGWLHDDLVTFLGGKEYHQFKPRGNYMGHEPFNKWTKPSCVLMGEDNYSDASGFPHAYKALGLGKLIGAPVPGTMTAVWWETQINGLLVFGIPQVGNWSPKDNTFLENFQIEPDILIYNDPASMVSGRDPQLEAAVEEMLRQTAR